MFEPWEGEIGNGSRKGVVLESQSGGRNVAGKFVVLEEEVFEGRKRGDIRRKISIEEIGTKAETIDAYPSCTNGGGRVPVKFPTMRDCSSKGEKGLFVRVQVYEAATV
ncbi:hypothetical protein U1Q18_033656 [Sarracenia purpurea var. burkii]